MKYQQLENLECGWKWAYLVKKHREGEEITRYTEKSQAEEAVAQLLKLESHPVKVTAWIQKHMAPGLANRMSQTIRARRKRHFNAEQQHTRKNRLIWSFWSGSGCRRYHSGAAVPYRTRLCSCWKMRSARKSTRRR